MATSLAQSAPPASEARKRWTVEEYLAMPDDGRRYELFRGELIEMPSPTPEHQRLLKKLGFLLDTFVEQHKLGEVFLAPLDVLLDAHDTVQPDILFIATAHERIVQKRIVSAPDMAIEILLPSSIRRDRYDKLELYAEFGVKEYWIVDMANRSVEILALQNGRYTVHSSAADVGTVSSALLAGLEVDLARIF